MIGYARPVLALGVLAAVGISRTSPAQDEEVADERQAPPARAAFPPELLDSAIFGYDGGEAEARRSLERTLEERIRDVDHACSLTEPQRQKLRLAGRGDILRLVRQAEELRKQLDAAAGDLKEIMRLGERAGPLREAMNSAPFSGDSLFAKALRKALDEGQAAKLEAALRGRFLSRYRELVPNVVAAEGRRLKLSDEQQRRFAEALVEKMPEPRVDDSPTYVTVLTQAASLPEGELRPIFEEVQWKRLTLRFEQARVIDGVRRTDRARR